jgi:uncharacterized ferritin-like protein (DUF455 family)
MALFGAEDFCRELLCRGDLASKLRPPRDGDGKLLPFCGSGGPFLLDAPARDAPLRLQKGGERLPSAGALREPRARAICLRRFAHHELQAIELFAWGVLHFTALPPALRRGFLLVLEEEQLHLALYLERLLAHGETLEGGPLSDYLWQHRARIEAHDDPPLAFLSALGLTLEQANLDFAQIYRDAFAAAGDLETAAVLQRVHDDEIRHVRLAVRWLRRLKRSDESDLQAYLRTVPFPLSAARAKGRRFDPASRRLAGLDDAFIAYVGAAEPYEKSSPRNRPAAEPDRLWLLPNLGAEESQAVPKSARGFLRGLYGAWAALFSAERGAPLLLSPGDDDAQAAWRQALSAAFAGAALPGLAAGGGLIAWLNTPSAEEVGRAHRLPLHGAPPDATLAVHDKAFAQQVAEAMDLHPVCLRGLITIFSSEDCAEPAAANARLADWVRRFPDWTGRRFVLKPRLSTSGRNRVFGTWTAGGIAPGVTDAAWRLLGERGGCVVEPWLERGQDLSLQMIVQPEAHRILGTTAQLLTRSGQILGNRGIVDESGALRAGVDPATEEALHAAAEKLGAAAARRGFFGVAGVDAFSFRGPDGKLELRAVVEMNARFTTGTVALGLVRRLEAAGLLPPRHVHAHAHAWALILKAPEKAGKVEVPGVTCICPLPRGPALIVAQSPSLIDEF